MDTISVSNQRPYFQPLSLIVRSCSEPRILLGILNVISGLSDMSLRFKLTRFDGVIYVLYRTDLNCGR